MEIRYDALEKTFHLTSGESSYVMKLVKDGRLAHLYWGRKLRAIHSRELPVFTERCSFCPNPDPQDATFSLDTLPQEFPAYGTSDFRHPAIEVEHADGSRIVDFRYKNHRIHSGKLPLEGLPATYGGEEAAMTLELLMKDTGSDLEASLYYSVFEGYSALTRWVVLRNQGEKSVKIKSVLSASVDFQGAAYDCLHLEGFWARERHIRRAPLSGGTFSIGSRRGASGHHHNPFFALLSKGAGEDFGEVYAFSLIYSGNFLAFAEVDPFSNTRVGMGIGPSDFSWMLEPGKTFTTPEVVLVYSEEGLGKMSRTYHSLYRNQLMRGRHKELERPILMNNWEATYFDFNREKLLRLAKEGSKLGMELFVLDDGWFGKRNSDASSLGDWTVNGEKLPQGLEELGKSINALGMKFGLWFEPEMVSPDSELYRQHPDWCLHVPERPRTEGRHQLVLDLSRKEVRDHLFEKLSAVLCSAPVDYVKWDMNRNMTEVGSASLPAHRQSETAHRYMLGVYELMDRVTSSFPHILFESCSGGGGRFDPGMLYYMPQTWTSDNTDAVERLNIQFGTSLVYPPISMGAHVSAVPNHQVGRNTSLQMRGDVAMAGNLGYELDLTRISEVEKQEIRAQIEQYKRLRPLIQFGDFYRLKSPFEGEETAWMFVSPDKRKALFLYYRVHAVAHPPISFVKMKGLNPDVQYRILEKDEIYGGDELMQLGMPMPIQWGDFQSLMWTLEQST